MGPPRAPYIYGKTQNSLEDWRGYLENVGLEGLDVSSFVPASNRAIAGVTVPMIGITASGGAQRATMFGGAIMNALDGRNSTAVKAKVGGVLQLAQYCVGLSGGSWLVGSYAVNGFPSLMDLAENTWKMDGGASWMMPDFAQAFELASSFGIKAMSGAPVSFVDIYGRGIAHHTINDPRSGFDLISGTGAATLWSGIRDTAAFRKKQAPFPIVIALGRSPGELGVSSSDPIYEFNPYRLRTDHPTTGGLSVPIEYLGTSFNAGKPTDTGKCVTGFDNAGCVV
ncbi:hypothetical protein RQP46_008332 [Phenoliferia psychrophenolica]